MSEIAYGFAFAVPALLVTALNPGGCVIITYLFSAGGMWLIFAAILGSASGIMFALVWAAVTVTDTKQGWPL